MPLTAKLRRNWGSEMKNFCAAIAVLTAALATPASAREITEPDWTHKPSIEAVQDLFPPIPLALGLRGYAERDPKIEFKREGTRLFNELNSNIRERVTDLIFKVQTSIASHVASEPTAPPATDAGLRGTARKADATNAAYAQAAPQRPAQEEPPPVAPIKREHPKVGSVPAPQGRGKREGGQLICWTFNTSPRPSTSER